MAKSGPSPEESAQLEAAIREAIEEIDRLRALVKRDQEEIDLAGVRTRATLAAIEGLLKTS